MNGWVHFMLSVLVFTDLYLAADHAVNKNPLNESGENPELNHKHGGVSGESGKHTTHSQLYGIWVEAIASTVFIGVAPIALLLFVPIGLRPHVEEKFSLRILSSFAAGGLLGDVFLHLLPHSMPTHEHSRHHEHDMDGAYHEHSISDFHVWLWTLCGIILFLSIEKFIRANLHDRACSHKLRPVTTKVDDHSTGKASSRKNSAGKLSKTSSKSCAGKNEGVASNDPEIKVKKIVSAQECGSIIAPAGYLNLIADFAHNFTDGLAIGATYLQGSGRQTTLAILLHELPHEIGDFAILLRSGFSRRQAMLVQFCTALGALAGTILGLLAEGADQSSPAWISPLTAGGFIYIACCSIIPDLMENCSMMQSLKEIGSLVAGISLMAVIIVFE